MTDLADELGVSERAIRRDLAALESLGFRIERSTDAEDRVGVRLRLAKNTPSD
jgi:predicted DNA-binding transcriptional regulator YafY